MTKARMICAAIALVVAGSTHAQQGSGPVASIGADAPKSGSVAPLPAPAAVPPGQSVTAPPQSTQKRPPRMKTSAPPSEITVESGKNTNFSVALFHVNRIVTPFRNPEVRTSSTATLTIENGIVYVTTQSEEPIGLFVFDKADPAQAISLTLMPHEISPVSVKVNLAGYSAVQASYAVAGDPSVARTWETEDPYVETVKNLFKELASGRVPDGFGLSAVPGRYAFTPACDQYGLHVVPMQLIEGSQVTAIVARVTNVGYQPIEVNESACKSERMVGAATWPKSLLNPGESSELFLAIKTPEAADTASMRPSVISGGLR